MSILLTINVWKAVFVAIALIFPHDRIKHELSTFTGKAMLVLPSPTVSTCPCFMFACVRVCAPRPPQNLFRHQSICAFRWETHILLNHRSLFCNGVYVVLAATCMIRRTVTIFRLSKLLLSYCSSAHLYKGVYFIIYSFNKIK